MLVTGIFWEAFNAVSAVTALLSIGFADADVDAVGVLAGQPPDLSGFLASAGVSQTDASRYNDCFQEGAFLLLVRTQPDEQTTAINIIQTHGGVLASELSSVSPPDSFES
ncbi:MAG TPA: hypothetical protein VGF08_02895 [Terriglobales bacterium]|jgi:hypothetical protein